MQWRNITTAEHLKDCVQLERERVRRNVLSGDVALIREAIAHGKIEVAMSSGRWWRARLNGETQTWKTRPGEFSIPIKAGFKSCGRFTDLWLSEEGNLWRVRED